MQDLPFSKLIKSDTFTYWSEVWQWKIVYAHVLLT